LTHYKRPKLPIFIAYGPMTSAYEPLVLLIVRALQGAGIAAQELNLTLPHGMTGCYGHPSHADHLEIAAKAKPQLAAVLGWE
jgi:hypothetical protein